MVIDNLSIFGKTVDSVKNTMIDNIHIKGGKAPFVWNDDFHFASETNSNGLGIVECADSVDEPLQSLKISGNTWSSTSNLLDFTTPKITTNSGMTVTRNNNELTFSGTLQTWQVYIPSTPLILKDGDYILSCSKYYTYGEVGVRAQIIATPRPNLGLTTITHQGWGGAIKFTIDNTKYTYIVRIQAGPTAGEFNETLRWWLNEGSTALAYEPFEAVNATPTKLTVDSESLTAFPNFSTQKNGVTMSYDGEFLTINGTCTSNADIVQHYVNIGVRKELPTGPIKIVFEHVSGSTPKNISLWYGWSTQTSADTLYQATVDLTNNVYIVKSATISNYRFPMNLFFRPATGAVYDNFKVRFRFGKYTPQTVTIPSTYDMSRGNSISLTTSHKVYYNNTDITQSDYEFAQKLLALKTYDGYSRVRVDSNVPVPIKTNYWKQIKP